jgi:TRAF3-interacting protein 1
MGDFWQLTQQMLQGEEPLIKRPKLTDALLNKPPFRFLHDIISEVSNKTSSPAVSLMQRFNY